MVSVKKCTIFSSVFFSKIGLEIMFSYGLERKEAFEDDKNVNFLKSKKMGIFQRGSPMVSLKKSTIFSSVFFSKIGLEIMFSYGPERKKAFDDNKNFNFFNSKNGYFPKGFTHGSSQKIHNFF